jgi:hypothetical protein
LTESNKSGDAEVDIEQEPELRPIWVFAKVYGTLHVVYKLDPDSQACRERRAVFAAVPAYFCDSFKNLCFFVV